VPRAGAPRSFRKSTRQPRTVARVFSLWVRSAKHRSFRFYPAASRSGGRLDPETVRFADTISQANDATKRILDGARLDGVRFANPRQPSRDDKTMSAKTRWDAGLYEAQNNFVRKLGRRPARIV
jgi:hypothetical protein